MKKRMLKTLAMVLLSGSLSLSGIPALSLGTAPETVQAAQSISKTKAKEIALADAKTKESNVKQLKVKKDGKEYEVKFEKGSFRYEYDVRLRDGKITDLEIKRISLSSSDKKKDIGKKKARSIALKKAGTTQSNVSGLKVKGKKTKKGFGYYKVEFQKSGKEYEYEIDRYTGLILDEDIDS